MGSERGAAHRLAWGLAARATATAALFLTGLWLIAHAGLYATGAIVLAAAILVAFDLAHAARRADRVFADFVEALAAGAADTPSRAAERFPALAKAVARAAARLDSDRRLRDARVHELQALLDTVSAALLVVEDDGRVTPVNRAAQLLCGAAAGRPARSPALGEAARALGELRPGSSVIVSLPDQRRMLAAAAGFRPAEGARRRLISLQSVAGELSAVEMNAWQDLVRVLAHEMMNSLTPIVSLAQSLHEAGGGATSEEAAGAIEVIARRSSGLMSFVERYRRLAELPAPASRPLPAAAFAADLDRLMRGLLAEKAIAYESRVEPRNLQIRADPELLEQALINLLKNAVEAVDGRPDPRVALVIRQADGQTALSVIDNGRGLPGSDPDRVFTPFFTTKAGGSGIGLSLARQVAIAHGGALTAAPNDPAGAVFTLTLPPG